MTRRSTVQQNPRRIAGDPESYPPDAADRGDAAHGASFRRAGGWSGGGGRWLVWIGRAILWALIIVIVVNGVRAPFERMRGDAGAPATSATPSDLGFPVTQGAAFAIQFAAVYLNYDAANPQQRAERLRPFLPEGADAQFGWNGYGRMSAGALQFAGIEVTDANNARVTVMYQSGGTRGLLSVPIYHDGGRFVVSGRPAMLPASGPAGLPQLPEPDRDSAAEAELRPQLEGFFKAYAAGDHVDLQRYVVNGAPIEGFGGGITLAQLKDVIVPPGPEDSRVVTAVVVWAVESQATPAPSATPGDPVTEPASLEQAYRLTMEKQGGKWFVKDIQGAHRSAG